MADLIEVEITSDPRATPPGQVVLDVYWLGPGGRPEKHLGDLPVSGGLVDVGGLPPKPAELTWGLVLREAGAAGTLLRSGPLRELPVVRRPGALPAGLRVFVMRSAGVQFAGAYADALRGLVVDGLPDLPRLQAGDVAIALGSGTGPGPWPRLVVTLTGRVRAAFPPLWLPFSFGVKLRAVPFTEPGRPDRQSVVSRDGPAVIGAARVVRGAVAAAAPALERVIVEAVRGFIDHEITREIAPSQTPPEGFVMSTVSTAALEFSSPAGISVRAVLGHVGRGPDADPGRVG